MTQITTTLAEIRSHRPCKDGFAKIRDHFGVSADEAKTHSKPFPVALLLETNDLDDALWVTAHVAPDALTRFLIRLLDDGDHSVLKTLRGLDGDWSRQIEAVETVAALLRRKLAGEDVCEELKAASDAASDAARDVARDVDYAAAYSARAAAFAASDAARDVAYAAADSARAAALSASYAAYSANDANDAARDNVFDAAYAAASDDLIAALEKENDG